MRYTVKELEVICAEVERQGASPRFVPGLVSALDYAHSLRDYGQDDLTHSNVMAMAAKINLVSQMHYRKTPVVFQNGGSSAPAREIPRLMERLLPQFSLMIDGEFNKALLKELLWIHPFTDGNGRLAFVIWNWLYMLEGDGNLYSIQKTPEFEWMN